MCPITHTKKMKRSDIFQFLGERFRRGKKNIRKETRSYEEKKLKEKKKGKKSHFLSGNDGERQSFRKFYRRKTLEKKGNTIRVKGKVGQKRKGLRTDF